MSVFTAYLHFNCGEVSSFARKNLLFCGISTVVFLVIISGGVFQLGVSGSARFFPAVQTFCKLENFIKITGIYKLYGLGSILV